jgi:hypothetical protein
MRSKRTSENTAADISATQLKPQASCRRRFGIRRIMFDLRDDVIVVLFAAIQHPRDANLAAGGIARASIFAVISMQIADCPTTQTETHGQFISVRQYEYALVLLPGDFKGVRWILQSAFSGGRTACFRFVAALGANVRRHACMGEYAF